MKFHPNLEIHNLRKKKRWECSFSLFWEKCLGFYNYKEDFINITIKVLLIT